MNKKLKNKIKNFDTEKLEDLIELNKKLNNKINIITDEVLESHYYHKINNVFCVECKHFKQLKLLVDKVDIINVLGKCEKGHRNNHIYGGTDITTMFGICKDFSKEEISLNENIKENIVEIETSGFNIKNVLSYYDSYEFHYGSDWDISTDDYDGDVNL